MSSGSAFKMYYVMNTDREGSFYAYKYIKWPDEWIGGENVVFLGENARIYKYIDREKNVCFFPLYIYLLTCLI